MHVPFVDLTRQSGIINRLILRKIGKIVDKGSFILGNEVSQFEKEFAKYVGTKYCIGVASGTDIISNAHLHVIRTAKRDQLCNYLRNKDIFCVIHYPIPLHLQPALTKLGYSIGNFPNTERQANSCLSLPMYPELTIEEVRFISKEINAFFTS